MLVSEGLVLALRDGYPVSRGHSLIVPRRHAGSFGEVSLDEQGAMLAMLQRVRAMLDAELRPDGYNIGINDGAAAGQTVMHVHMHVIPRYRGDRPDPRGGDSLDHSGEGRLLERQGRMTAPPGDRGQLDFLQHVQRIFDEGSEIRVRARFVILGMDGAAVLHYHPTYDKDRHDGFRPARSGAGCRARAPLRADRRHAQQRGAAEHGAVPRRALRPDARPARRGAAAAAAEAPCAPLPRGALFTPAALPGLRA